MKKVLLLGLVLTLTGCNKACIDTHYTYDKAVVKMPDGSIETINVKSWADYNNSDSVSIITTDGKMIYTHLSNVVLYKDN